ncbi:hypothetical protein TREMEDRAFT_25667 [Tremella mesenterica DSM 1558]|uniref:uncharacterized protein n=1 Tax=Tremella mesenterica (strain ATCC 24925 / CBS 8224 / DSM 1558 / NBRC 9311 / NRRL Y-6157 / RJB 2259-6 / UBC 559-6) TaxID=578456 RepID=UPI0003F4905D|nr:uncharacterized protein TREMEDRAFT_25667 [Tremella mesenterica DSM 1558]EIW72027.1 hypothetical protein TREMEDRAFT_25667 [Tremella mesenterica DSM 1558]
MSPIDPHASLDCPPLNIVIFIVGSRGDVQPYLSLALRLIESYSHRVRIATHPDFRDFVLSENKRLRGKRGKDGVDLEGKLEYFDIGGDPKDLMAYMVKNPGLLPAMESLRNGDISSKRRMTATMLDGFWESTHCPDPASGKPFAADAIISNPPAFGHVHIAEALGLPLMMSFTMPWTPTKSFKHPLVNIRQSNAEESMTYWLSYDMADLLTWQGLGDIINAFRTVRLGLEPLSAKIGSRYLQSLQVPWTYCWSEGLIPKPRDWAENVEISGFYFLEGTGHYTPSTELASFLKGGKPPIYIGFGSVVVEDPQALTNTILEAVKTTGVRAIISAGWGGLGGVDVPKDVYILKESVPHDWLFADGRVAAVCHHGGAGTTAIGLRNGLPTIVVPFFGDQRFWGEMIFKAGGGPAPIPHKTLTAENLADAIKFALSSEAQVAARKMGEKIRKEDGEKAGMEAFHRHLPLNKLR